MPSSFGALNQPANCIKEPRRSLTMIAQAAEAHRQLEGGDVHERIILTLE
jgi:hypothetical protein